MSNDIDFQALALSEMTKEIRLIRKVLEDLIGLWTRPPVITYRSPSGEESVEPLYPNTILGSYEGER